MNAEEIETEQRPPAYFLGRTLKEAAALLDIPLESTSDGFAIQDHELYAISCAGIFLVE